MGFFRQLQIATDRFCADGLDYHLMSVILGSSTEYTEEQLMNMTYEELLDVFRNLPDKEN